MRSHWICFYLFICIFNWVFSSILFLNSLSLSKILLFHLTEGSHHKKIPCIQRQRRSCNKMAGGVKLHLESNPIPTREAPRAQKTNNNKKKKTLCAPGPRDPTEAEPDLPLSVGVSPVEASVSRSLPRGQGSGYSRPGSGNITHHEQMTHKLQNNYTKEILSLLRKF